MATKKKKVPTKKDDLGFRPLVAETNKRKPLQQIYNGFEIEKRWVLLTHEQDYTSKTNGPALYNEALEKGTRINQGYIEIFDAPGILEELGIEIDFKPNTVRLRKFGKKFILTLKDRKATKRREVEWELDKKTFNKYWPLTKGRRVEKIRYEKKVKKNTIVFDAFIDRFLLLAEIEVTEEALLEKLPKLGYDVTSQKEWTNKSLSK